MGSSQEPIQAQARTGPAPTGNKAFAPGPSSTRRSTWLFALSLTLILGGVGDGVAAQTLIISEFMASNSAGLQDEDGDRPDWIEIFNTGTNAVNAAGWSLTDSSDDLTKWTFPATNIPPGAFLVVFASGKDRRVPGAPLHSRFSLSASGEYLALVRPDGTIASEFAPVFPPQVPDISYGIGQNLLVTALVSNASPAQVYFPSNSSLGSSWLAADFDDTGWRRATNGVGYETYVGGFAIKNIRANLGVCDLTTADSVLATPSLQGSVFNVTRSTVNFVNTGSGGNFAGDVTFPGFTINVDEDNFVIEATGILTIPTSGNWTFGVNSDDGFRCVIGANTFSYPSPRGPGDTFATFNLAAGEYPLRLVFYECGGGSELELFAAPGAWPGFNANFRLVGDTAGGGLAVKSLPTGAGGSSLRPLIATDVQADMLNRGSSAYVRLPFVVSDPARFSTLTLRVQYDDGFVAYLNGTEVARRNAPASPQWNSTATSNRNVTNVLVFEDMDVTAGLNALRAGNNVLAIQGLNDTAASQDFLVLAELAENKVLGTTNHYFSTPSPGSVNGAGFYAFVENLKFTPGRGWFDSTNFTVTITSATPGISIRYTTNGSAPTTTTGLLYPPAGLRIGGTTVLRVVGFRDGFEPTEVETHSYIFLDQVQGQSTNNNWAGGSSDNYTLATAVTQSPLYGPTFKNDLVGIPTLSIVMAWADVFGPNGVWSNPQAEGVAWERPCSLEYMRPDGEKGFNVNCGIRIQGGASRSLVPKHGFRVLFKNIYGPGKLEYPLYPDSPVQEFDTLTLHAAFNDHWLWVGASAQMLRDPWCRDTQNAMGGYGPHGTFVHIYLNGLYWGVYNMGEKGDASYAAHYLGGDKEEYDAFNSDELIDGDRAAWDTMFNLVAAGASTDAAYANLRQYVNVPNFIDYMLMNFYGANTDWPWHNWNAARRRVPGAGFHFFCWDAEWTLGIGNDINTDRTTTADGSPGRIFFALRQHPEFLREFGDHAQKYLFNGGALTPGPADARWMKRAAELDRAIVPESARWGNGYTRQTWLNAQAGVRSWFPQRANIVIAQLRNAGLYPTLNAPRFSQFGGLVPPGYGLELVNDNPFGTIYFTLDGSDPRLWGGGLASSAQLYTALVPLNRAGVVRARIRDGSSWSALVEAPFYVVQDFRSLAITEIMYQPLPQAPFNSDDLEFVELKNTGTSTLDLSGLQFTAGITFAFTNGTRLAPGAFFVLARSAAAFAARYPGIAVDGLFSGRLDNGGETLALAHVLGTNVFSFRYDNRPPWPITPDGYGFSLVRARLDVDPDRPEAWRPSANPGGSPGADDPPAHLPPVVINEVLTHTVPPQLDAIELNNPTATAANIGGWYLSDDRAQPKKFRIPNGTTIGPGGFVVFDESAFNPQPGGPASFALSSHGESLFLFSGDAAGNLTGYSHSFEYGVAAAGVSFGRYVISTGEEQWPAQISNTLPGANAGPRVGPVVINEILYHPAVGFDEFIELHNLSGSAVPLYDPAAPTNAWKLSGAGYVFSNHVVLPPGSFLLLVPIDPALFRSKYSVPASAQIVGPYAGVLQDSGERLRLERPGPPELDTNGVVTVPYIVVDEVRYNDRVPWPLGADGDGPSLQRRLPTAYGNEPTNWFASGITPGAANVLNQAPVLFWLNPTNDAVFSFPPAVVLSVAASDPDGTIKSVEFYDGDVLIGSLSSSPYTLIWSNAPVGAHQLVAKARDNGLAVTVSGPLHITVEPPPVGLGIGLRADYYDNIDFTGTRVRRVDPGINFDWAEGSPDPSLAPDTFSARWIGQIQPRFSETYTFSTVSDDGIRLWVDNQLIVDSWIDQSPTEHAGTIALQAGTLYDLKVEFYENGGGALAQLWWSSPSVSREIVPAAQLYPPASSNVPPVVNLTSPTTGAVFVATSTVNLAANATDLDGVVVRVEFWNGANKIGEDTSGPFTFAWSNVSAGVKTLTAVAVDDSGIRRTSAPVTITMVAGFTSNLTLITTGAVWKYFDQGTDLGSSWVDTDYADGNWSSGPAQLGYGDGDERTVVGFGPNPSAKYVTTYFRHAFVVSDPASFSSLDLRILRDDGAVVYLNGSEVYRNNMPAGPIGYLTLALGAVPDETSFFASPVAPGYLVPEKNVVSVEIHQANGTSSDISFDFELTGVQSFLAPTISLEPQSQTVGEGAAVSFNVVASGTAPLRYQWRRNGASLAGATNAAFTIVSANSSHAGVYSVIVSNVAGVATSANAILTVSTLDADGDGLPDAWELAHGLRVGVNDAGLDPDQDGASNREEFLAGTDPQDPLSVLRVAQVLPGPGICRITFIAFPDHSYSVLARDVLSAGSWVKVGDVAARPALRTEVVIDNRPTSAARFYRLVSPSVP